MPKSKTHRSRRQGQARLHPCRPQRAPGRRRQHHRRRPHPRGDAVHQVRPRGGAGHGHLPPGPPRRGTEADDPGAPAVRLGELLGKPVRLVQNWVGGVDVPRAKSCCWRTAAATKGEKKDNEETRQKMAALCDIYVMDAFGTAHRAEATTHGIARFAPGGLRRHPDGRRDRRPGQASHAPKRPWWPSSAAPRLSSN